jgi:hypothetical protein
MSFSIMTNEQRLVLKDWQSNFQRFLGGHYEAATRCERRNLWFGIPVVVLSALVGTSIFSALGWESAPPWAKILVGCVSLLVAVLAALQTFLKYSERGEKHRIAGASFAALHKEIDQMLVLSPPDDEKLEIAMTSLRTRWDKLAKESPTIPPRIYTKHRTTELHAREHSKFTEGGS